MWRLLSEIVIGNKPPESADEPKLVADIRRLVAQRDALVEALNGKTIERQLLSSPDIDELCVNCHDLLTIVMTWNDPADDVEIAIPDKKDSEEAWRIINKIRAFTGPDEVE